VFEKELKESSTQIKDQLAQIASELDGQDEHLEITDDANFNQNAALVLASAHSDNWLLGPSLKHSMAKTEELNEEAKNDSDFDSPTVIINEKAKNNESPVLNENKPNEMTSSSSDPINLRSNTPNTLLKTISVKANLNQEGMNDLVPTTTTESATATDKGISNTEDPTNSYENKKTFNFEDATTRTLTSSSCHSERSVVHLNCVVCYEDENTQSQKTDRLETASVDTIANCRTRNGSNENQVDANIGMGIEFGCGVGDLVIKADEIKIEEARLEDLRLDELKEDNGIELNNSILAKQTPSPSIIEKSAPQAEPSLEELRKPVESNTSESKKLDDSIVAVTVASSSNNNDTSSDYYYSSLVTGPPVLPSTVKTAQYESIKLKNIYLESNLVVAQKSPEPILKKYVSTCMIEIKKPVNVGNSKQVKVVKFNQNVKTYESETKCEDFKKENEAARMISSNSSSISDESLMISCCKDGMDNDKTLANVNFSGFASNEAMANSDEADKKEKKENSENDCDQEISELDKITDTLSIECEVKPVANQEDLENSLKIEINSLICDLLDKVVNELNQNIIPNQQEKKTKNETMFEEMLNKIKEKELRQSMESKSGEAKPKGPKGNSLTEKPKSRDKLEFFDLKRSMHEELIHLIKGYKDTGSLLSTLKKKPENSTISLGSSLRLSKLMKKLSNEQTTDNEISCKILLCSASNSSEASKSCPSISMPVESLVSSVLPPPPPAIQLPTWQPSQLSIGGTFTSLSNLETSDDCTLTRQKTSQTQVTTNSQNFSSTTSTSCLTHIPLKQLQAAPLSDFLLASKSNLKHVPLPEQIETETKPEIESPESNQPEEKIDLDEMKQKEQLEAALTQLELSTGPKKKEQAEFKPSALDRFNSLIIPRQFKEASRDRGRTLTRKFNSSTFLLANPDNQNGLMSKRFSSFNSRIKATNPAKNSLANIISNEINSQKMSESLNSLNPSGVSCSSLKHSASFSLKCENIINGIIYTLT
jgi:hypothetical protein